MSSDRDTFGMLELSECDRYYFDEAAADRPVNFIERYCRHYEGRHAGERFVLQPVQKRIIRDLWGWRHKGGPDAGKKRFTDCYWEAAVGAGKSPLLAGLGLFGLMAEGEQGAQVYSLASTYKQARVVFECAKKFAAGSPELRRRLKLLQFEIRHPASNSAWELVSGDGTGGGRRPSLVLGDEAHEWKGAGAYQPLRDRMAKRDNALMLIATNAGDTRAGFCWQLRERAVAALEGTGDPAMYPVIWKARDDADPNDPESWRAANPLMGITINESKVAEIVAGGVGDPVKEAHNKRMYCSIWPKVGATRWLDLAAWDECVEPAEKATCAPELWASIDLSQGDDLCATAFIQPADGERFRIDVKFYLPRATAALYEDRDGIQYRQWEREGHIVLLDEPTISKAARRRIAADVLAHAKAAGRKLVAVCYDPFRADVTVAELEAADVACVPVRQGFSLSPGCFELARRIKERSVSLTANPVLRWNAENTEIKTDDKGNIWPVKPNANPDANYAGTRGKKIDGIAAVVTGFTEARKHAFPKASTKWKGIISLC